MAPELFPQPTVTAVKTNAEQLINETINKYGWKVIPVHDCIILFNPANIPLCSILLAKERYDIYDVNGKKLLSGNNPVQIGCEKLLKEYYYAQATIK